MPNRLSLHSSAISLISAHTRLHSHSSSSHSLSSHSSALTLVSTHTGLRSHSAVLTLGCAVRTAPGHEFRGLA